MRSRKWLAVPLAILSCSYVTSMSPAAAQSPDELVLVVNSANDAAQGLTKDDARKLLLGETTTWSNKAKVVIALPPSGSPQREAILKRVCGMNETIYTRRQLQAAFTGNQAASLHDAPSAAVVKNFVKTNPGALGFLHKSEVDASVKVAMDVQ
ncbi:hypothetical protein DYQ86_26755 [Acidobacteria bacterium AB60]|nr:hypothetical protein DYQ86_26755 [Acidobacteria bacterium AB60]